MGNVLSRVKLLKAAIKQLLTLSKSYERVLKRVEASPGIPRPNPSQSLWMENLSPIAFHRPKVLPEHVDVVIIGSGITGTAIARTMLREAAAPLKVVMLEARSACSGATGRNGGHIKPPLHHDYGTLKRKHGSAAAQDIIRFRLAHVHELLKVASEEESLKSSQCREVESLDVYYDPALFEEAKGMLQEWKADMPAEARDYSWMDNSEHQASDKFHLAPTVAGVIYNQAGAVHPYRLVTTILERLLEDFEEQFILSTETPCTSISSPSTDTPYYTVVTPRGTITAPHIIHATNAWMAHLVEPMRTKIFPVRANMTAQRPGTRLTPSTMNGHRSWVFYDKHLGYDYLTQLPTGENELMFGGGFFQGSDDNGLGEIGNTDDSIHNPGVTSHLGGALPALFGERNWGAESHPPTSSQTPDDKWFEGRVKALWSGIIGVSADGLPWVGRLPLKVSGRKEPPVASTPSFRLTMAEKEHIIRRTAAPGEWVAAGYSGEGMAHAFLSGKALAYMVLAMEQEGELSNWFPDVMRVTVSRWEKAKPENLLGEWQ